MNEIISFQDFVNENEINEDGQQPNDVKIKTRIYQGVPEYADVVNYIGMVSKYKNEPGQGKDQIGLFLRNNNATSSFLQFLKDYLMRASRSNPQLFSKLGGASMMKNIDDLMIKFSPLPTPGSQQNKYMNSPTEIRANGLDRYAPQTPNIRDSRGLSA